MKMLALVTISYTIFYIYITLTEKRMQKSLVK